MLIEIWYWLNTQEGWLALYAAGLGLHAVFGSVDYTRKALGGLGGWHFVRWGGYSRAR